MTDPWCCYIWCAMDPINIPPVMLAYIPAPWIRHGQGNYVFLGPAIPKVAYNIYHWGDRSMRNITVAWPRDEANKQHPNQQWARVNQRKWR